MKKVYTFLLASSACLFVCNVSFAQTTPSTPDRLNKAIYVEALGNGPLISLNYDTRLKKGIQGGLGLRAGVGTINVEGTDSNGTSVDVNIISVPVALNYLVGQKRSAFEAGVGVTPIYLANELLNDNGIYTNEGLSVVGFLNAGYRFHSIRNGVMFRLTWTPAISSEGFTAAYGGFSLGMNFK
ncbi:MAG: hypothetical protein ACOYNO_07865 [Saprospiraceae bacterium]